jgi:hypothetical protein
MSINDDMTRSFNILEGAGRGTTRPLASALMIVGRSRNADFQIEDDMVSRRHLEVRVEGEAVFVENKSTQGSLLNGKPLVGVVSLNPGDIIEVGHTKLRYEETAEQPGPAPDAGQDEASSAELDGTRIASPEVSGGRQKGENPPPDATRAVVEDGTRMLNPSELPNWVAAEKRKEASAKGFGAGLMIILLILVLLGGGAFWYMRRNMPAHPGATMVFKDALYGYNFTYPLDWGKTADDANMIGFGFGKETSPEWGRVNIYTDKDPEYALTGLTEGFDKYQDVLKKRYPGFELNGSKVLKVNDATVMRYDFSSSAVQGSGIYVLNAEMRIAMECISPPASYQSHASMFGGILQSFNLGNVETQQFIDFSLPDMGQQQLALANPEELSRQVDSHMRSGGALLSAKDVKPSSLFEAVQEYRLAVQLADAPPQRLASYSDAARGLAIATGLLNQALEHQRFEVNRALKEGDARQAYWEANKMMQMVPDKTDPAYQEAYEIVKSLQNYRGGQQ